MGVEKSPYLILASKSPRRKDLLEQAGLVFQVIPSHIDEGQIDGSTPVDLVLSLAKAKARIIADSYPENCVIGADTLVLIDGEVLGKPDSIDTARRMLLSLSGRRHTVLTGYAIQSKSAGLSICGHEKTDVEFKKLDDREIEWYIRTGESFDKAGGYAIQGLGSFLVKRIYGSYTNVVGLPVSELLGHLYKAGIIEPSEGRRWKTCS